MIGFEVSRLQGCLRQKLPSTVAHAMSQMANLSVISLIGYTVCRIVRRIYELISTTTSKDTTDNSDPVSRYLYVSMQSSCQ